MVYLSTRLSDSTDILFSLVMLCSRTRRTFALSSSTLLTLFFHSAATFSACTSLAVRSSFSLFDDSNRSSASLSKNSKIALDQHGSGRSKLTKEKYLSYIPTFKRALSFIISSLATISSRSKCSYIMGKNTSIN